ncbi:MAG: nucleoside-triphosphatase [Candidatus Saliniplasma sp.]
MNNIFVTGPSGSGKSTLVHEIIEEMELEVEGIRTPDIREGRRRVGFKIVDVSTSEEGILAHVDQTKGPKLGKYRVCMEDLNKFAESCLTNVSSDIDMVVIDEIGTMELYSKKFEDAVKELLGSDVPVLAVLHRNYVSEYGRYGTVHDLEDDFDKVKNEIKQKLNDMILKDKG